MPILLLKSTYNEYLTFTPFFLLMIIFTFIENIIVYYLKQLTLLINNKNPMNLSNLGLLLPSLLLKYTYIRYLIFAIFFLLITISIFIERVVVNHLK